MAHGPQTFMEKDHKLYTNLTTSQKFCEKSPLALS
jgi:hypothetical protein